MATHRSAGLGRVSPASSRLMSSPVVLSIPPRLWGGGHRPDQQMGCQLLIEHSFSHTDVQLLHEVSGR